MGTGIVSVLLYKLPYNGAWLYWLSVIIFASNVFLFLLFTLLSLARYLMFRGLWQTLLRHPTQSLFLGTFPIALATIINMICFVCVPAWGPRAATLAWALWWIDVVFSLATNMILPFVVMYKHEQHLSTMTAVWLMPIVSTIVASATGAVVASILPDPQHALWTIIFSYILWGTGFPLSLVVLTMYFQRLTLHHLPPREVIVSVFLPLGAFGQGSFAIMQLGKDAAAVFPTTGTVPMPGNMPATEARMFAGGVLYVLGIGIALVFWGFALVWLFFAVASITRSKFPFNMGWWGFTFPIGVCALATLTLAQELPSLFFRIVGTILALATVIMWIVVSLGTLWKIRDGSIFFAPCLQGWEQIEAKRQAGERREVKCNV